MYKTSQLHMIPSSESSYGSYSPPALALTPMLASAVIEHHPVALFWVSPMGYFCYANRAAGRLFGYSPAQLIGMTLPDIELTLENDVWQSRFQRIRETGMERWYADCATSNGQSLTVEMVAGEIPDQNQIGVWLCVHDVSAYRQTERELRQRERQFRAFFDNSLTDINLKDRAGRYVMVSRQFEDNFKLPRGAAEGKFPHDIFPSEFADHVRRHDQEVMRSGRLVTQEDRIPGEQGDKTLLVTKFPILGTNQEIEGLGVIATDITYLKHVEDALRQSEERFRDFAQVAADFFWELDAQLRIRYLSKCFKHVTGLSEQDLLGKPVNLLLQLAIHNSDLQLSHLQDFLAQKPFQNIEYMFESADGKLCVVHSSGRPFYDQEGRFLGYRGIGRDVTVNYRLTRELAHQASHDSLTGLLNRRGFERALQEVAQDSRQADSVHVLCYIDLDQFKVVNDTCGHHAGDELLRRIAALMRDSVRCEDIVARLGGDEFAILLRKCPIAYGQSIIEKIHRAIDTFSFHWNQKRFTVSASIGLIQTTTAMLQSDSGQLLQVADTACYVAKESGRNRIHVHGESDPVMAERVRDMEWVARIHDALEQADFTFMMQPIQSCHEFSDNNGKGNGFYELLLRMRAGDGQLISPQQFMAAAEHYHIAPKVDRWAVQYALKHLITQNATLAQADLVAINLSGLALSDEGFLDHVIRLFQETGMDPRRICFEITETCAITYMSAALTFIRTLKQLGCRFALDDFGSGMSSFTYLKTLPVDFLKIDGLFVRSMNTDANHRVIVEAIHRVGRVMGLKTIAEHVEDETTRTILQDIGVDYVQGYGVGRPTLAE